CAGLVSWRFFHPVPVYAQLPMPAPATEAPHARGYDREVRYDLSILLHFAVDQATGALLDNLAMTAPRHDGLTAETDPKIRRRRINEIEAFIRRAASVFRGTERGSKIQAVLSIADLEAETLTKSINTLPPHLDQIDYLRCKQV